MKANIKQAVKSKIKVKKPNAKGILKSFFVKYDVVIIYVVLTLLLFTGIVFLFGGKGYSVSSFLWVQLIVLAIGILHAISCVRFIEWIPQYFSKGTFGFTIALSVLVFSIIYLSNVWSFLPDLPMAYSVSILMFAAPVFLMSAFEVYMSIPQKTWKSWSYPYGKEVPVIEVINPIKINFYIAKKINDDDYAHFALNVPVRYQLGEFMHYFIHRYNYDKNPEAPIWISENNENKNLYNWVFRTKPHSDKDSHLLDPDLSFEELKLEEMDVIIVERYESPIAEVGEVVELESIEEEEEEIESGSPNQDIEQPGSAH